MRPCGSAERTPSRHGRAGEHADGSQEEQRPDLAGADPKVFADGREQRGEQEPSDEREDEEQGDEDHGAWRRAERHGVGQALLMREWYQVPLEVTADGSPKPAGGEDSQAAHSRRFSAPEIEEALLFGGALRLLVLDQGGYGVWLKSSFSIVAACSHTGRVVQSAPDRSARPPGRGPA